VTMQRQAGVLMGVAVTRSGPVLLTGTVTHPAIEWECRACHGWRPVDEDDLCQDCVARLAAGLAESSAPPGLTPVGAPHPPHRCVERGSS
jgi:hypothetical protein